MKYITDTLDFSLERRSAVTLGKFDGLHRGHQKLVNRIRELIRFRVLSLPPAFPTF